MAKLPDGDIRWLEDVCWYDWIFCYEDKDTWKRYSKVAHIPIDIDEMCKYWEIYKVKLIKDGKWKFDYHYQILSSRPDKDDQWWND